MSRRRYLAAGGWPRALYFVVAAFWFALGTLRLVTSETLDWTGLVLVASAFFFAGIPVIERRAERRDPDAASE